MYVQNYRIFAALGRYPEVRSLLEEAVKNSPTDVLNSLSLSVLGELGTYVLTVLHEDLAAYEKVRDRNQADPTFLAAAAKLVTMIRQPVVVNLSEVVVGTATPVGTGPTPRYTHRAEFYPADGQGADVAGHLEEFAKAEQAAGRPLFRMARRVYGASGAVFTLGDSHQTLAEAEDVARQRAERTRALGVNLAGKLRAPASQELREIIVPFSA